VACQHVAGHLLERDLVWPTDVHDPAQRLGHCSCGDPSGDVIGGDRLDQGIRNPHFVTDGHRCGDRIGELCELGCAHDRVRQTRVDDQLLLGDLGPQVAAVG
jgi:hypothetical protein